MLKWRFKNDNSFLDISSKEKNFEQQKNELKKFHNRISLIHEKSQDIQAQFDFILPNYIIDEIISEEYSKNYSNLYALINLAIVNNRLSIENGQLVKKTYQ